MKFKVFFHCGNELSIATRVAKGYAWLDDMALNVEGQQRLTIPLSDILEAELFRLHGLCRVVRIDYRGGRLFLSVIRLMIGQFAFVNFFKTGALHRQIAAARNPPKLKETPSRSSAES